MFLDGFMHLGIEIPVLISCWSGENGALVGRFESGIVKMGLGIVHPNHVLIL